MPGRHDHREHRGLLLDFGGVLTTSLLEGIRQFCVESGLGPDALLDLLVDHERLVERLLSTVEPEPAILAAAERARAAGIRRLAGRFDTLVISQHTGSRKPDPAIYTLAAERLGLPCEACVFVDDLPHNLEPARALGMSVIHKTSADQLLTTWNASSASLSADTLG